MRADKAEAKLNIAREALLAIRSKTSIAGYDSGDSGVCSIAETALDKIK